MIPDQEEKIEAVYKSLTEKPTEQVSNLAKPFLCQGPKNRFEKV